MSGQSTTTSKTVKVALKEARDAIEKKDFKAALRCCKKALNVDKENYMALVFCGLCLAELEQSDQAVQVIKFIFFLFRVPMSLYFFQIISLHVHKYFIGLSTSCKKQPITIDRMARIDKTL